MSATRSRHKRARVPLVLRPHKPPPAQPHTSLPRHTLISTFHALLHRKQTLQSQQPTPVHTHRTGTDTGTGTGTGSATACAVELAAIERRLDGLGGLERYQRVSVAGERRGGGGGRGSGGGFTTAKWVMERLSGKEQWREALAEVRAGKRRKRQRTDNGALTTEQEETKEQDTEPAQEHLAAVTTPSLPASTAPPPKPLSPSPPRRPRLLDVGSLNNPYQPYAHLLDLLAIDLHPQHPSVRRLDFFDLRPASYRGRFDGIVLSLVVNFVGGRVRRGRMVRRAAEMVVDGGWVWCVLPAACVRNSRWVDEAVVRDVWRRCGLRVTEMHFSSRLVLVEATTDGSGVDGSAWQPTLVRHGKQHNNFSIALEAAEDDTGEPCGEEQLDGDDEEDVED